MASGAADGRVWTFAVGAALATHLAAVGGLSRLKPAWEAPPAPPVEFELREPPPPPPPVEEPPKPAPQIDRPIEIAKARIVRRAEPQPPAAPPPPNREPPPEAPKNAPPVFGVTMDSVVSGEGAAVAVPVGNTLMMKPTAPRADKPAVPYAGGAPQAFQPVPDVYIATGPVAIHKVEGEDVYPPDAKAVGLEGSVKLSVDVDEKGVVVGVRVIERGGHGFDEAAVKALRQFRYRPARASDGRPVPSRFTYTYRFTVSE